MLQSQGHSFPAGSSVFICVYLWLLLILPFIGVHLRLSAADYS
jgi:hypothetical protein